MVWMTFCLWSDVSGERSGTIAALPWDLYFLNVGAWSSALRQLLEMMVLGLPRGQALPLLLIPFNLCLHSHFRIKKKTEVKNTCLIPLFPQRNIFFFFSICPPAQSLAWRHANYPIQVTQFKNAFVRNKECQS